MSQPVQGHHNPHLPPSSLSTAVAKTVLICTAHLSCHILIVSSSSSSLFRCSYLVALRFPSHLRLVDQRRFHQKHEFQELLFVKIGNGHCQSLGPSFALRFSFIFHLDNRDNLINRSQSIFLVPAVTKRTHRPCFFTILAGFFFWPLLDVAGCVPDY